jgi:hypothetical protein
MNPCGAKLCRIGGRDQSNLSRCLRLREHVTTLGQKNIWGLDVAMNENFSKNLKETFVRKQKDLEVSSGEKVNV